MRQKRVSPLYSPFGCGTTVVLVLVLGAILRFKGGGPFSPGPLSAASPRDEPLAGYVSHAAFEEDCALCHVAWRGATADRCQQCHTEIAGQRAGDSGMHGRLPDTDRCYGCHTDHQGRQADLTHYELTSFEHNLLTEFSLQHHELDFDRQSLTCAGCHPGNTFVSEEVVCIDCHQAAEPIFIAGHGDLYGRDCQACHDGLDTMAEFDHQLVFPLDGAHFLVECDACHVASVLTGTPSDCIGCHQEPAVHAGSFGQDCIRCHTTTAWLPAHLSYHNFPLDHGDEGKIGCQTCHVQNYTTYTCTNCHAHEPAQVRLEHESEGIFEFEDCISCHPTGLKDEAGEDQQAQATELAGPDPFLAILAASPDWQNWYSLVSETGS